MKTFYLKIVWVFAVISTLSSGPDEGYKVGDVVRDFKLENVDGKMVSMSNYKDAKGFIIVFTCNTCPYSVANEDRLIALDKKYKSKGYPVIAINPNDPAAQRGEAMSDMKKRAKSKGFTFPYLFDKGQKVYPKFGATRTPHVYVLSNTKGKKVVEYIGAIDDSSRDESRVKEKYVEDVIAALDSGKKPAKTYTRAIGCSIKVLK